MKILIFILVGLFSLSAATTTKALPQQGSDLSECEDRYNQAAGPFFTRESLNNNLSIIADLPTEPYVAHALLSYKGRKVIGYDGTKFGNADGVLTKTVQDVMTTSEIDSLNAALVYSFLTAADNDADYPEVQLMALQLQPQFPNVKDLDWLIYYSIGKTEEMFPFCGEKLWTWKQIQEWLVADAIPAQIKKQPELVGTEPACREEADADGAVLNCNRDK